MFVVKKYIAIILSLILVFGYNVSAQEGKITVSSECDISDINVPFKEANAQQDKGKVLDIKAKRLRLCRQQNDLNMRLHF